MKYEMILLAILTQFALFPSVARPQVLPQDPATQGRVVSASPEKQLPDEMAPDSSQDFVLGAGDIIEVSVIGIPGLDRQEFTLDGKCQIYLPYVNQVRLSGMTAHDAQIKIAVLFEVSLLENPQVTVRVKELKSQFCYVLGAVHKPGKIQLTQPAFLLDALTLAGGLTDKADVRLQIRHGSPPEPTTQAAEPPASKETQEIFLTDLFYDGDPRRNVAIHSGDIITVPERKEALYFVVGDIQKPGPFAIANGEKATLSKALANAGGPLKTASGSKTMIIRQNPGGEMPTQIKVDAVAVLKGEVRDIDLMENDIVLVPGSTSRTLGKNIFSGVNYYLGILLGIGLR